MTAVLVVGAGSIGSRHARNLRAIGVSQISVVDPDPERCRSVADATGARTYTHLDDALQASHAIAIVCPPPTLHVAAAMTCAAAGCDVLVEKPLAVSVAEADRMIAAVATHGRRAAVAYQLRFHAALTRVHDLIASGSIGRVLSLRAAYGNYLPAWRQARDYRETYTAQARQGGGILLDGSHEIDYVRWLGGEVDGVYAVAARVSDLDMDAEDTAALVLRQGAVIGEVHLDCVQRGYTRACVVVGSEATVHWDVATGVSITNSRGTSHHEAIVPDTNDAYARELRSFLETRDDDLAWASLADGRRVIAIVEAARESTRRRQEIAV